MPGSPSFQKPPTQVEAVLQEVRRALLVGDYPVGGRVNVDAISKNLGVSRAPVRDALRILEGEHQVQYEPHRGYVVPTLSLESLFDLYRTRELLEAEAIARAVPHLTDDDFAAIREACRAGEAALAAGDRVAATYANREFHFGLCSHPDHQQLLGAIQQAWNADAYRSLYTSDMDAAIASAREHQAMADAAEARDVGAVINLQNLHRDGELAQLLPQLEFDVDIDDLLARKPWRSAIDTSAFRL